jgi:hypothetical protein
VCLDLVEGSEVRLMLTHVFASMTSHIVIDTSRSIRGIDLKTLVHGFSERKIALKWLRVLQQYLVMLRGAFNWHVSCDHCVNLSLDDLGIRKKLAVSTFGEGEAVVAVSNRFRHSNSKVLDPTEGIQRT